MNISPLIAVIVSHKLATLNELETVYGLEDALNLYEIIAIDTYNEYQANERAIHGNNS